MSNKNKIRQAIKDMMPEPESISILCTVVSVNSNEKTCTVKTIDTDVELYKVKLMANNNTGFLILPKVNSIVVVSMVNEFTGYIGMFSEIDSIYLNGTNYDGLVRINDLVTKLNNLESAFNQHVTKYNAHIHSGGVLTGALTGVPTVPETNTLTPTVKSDLENTTVKHGNG